LRRLRGLRSEFAPLKLGSGLSSSPSAMPRQNVMMKDLTLEV